MRSRTWLLAAAVVLGLLVVLASAVGLPFAPFRAAATLVAETAHFAAALVGGSWVLRLVRSEPRHALGRIVFAGSLGLGVLALLTLLLAGLGLVHPLSPWIVDAVVLAVGAGRVRPLIAVLAESWARLDLSFVMASRIPLLAALAVVSLLHLAPPFLPTGPETGAAEHALTAQAAVRGDLRAALAARPGSAAGPVDGLLLHGRLSSGEVGARLHVALLVALLTGGTFLHARRRLGGAAAAWVGLCLASSPALLLLDLGAPAACWIALHGFLFFAELSDWSARPAPGKIALACVHGGLCLAQSAAGLAVFGAVLTFTLLVEGLVERQAAWRLVPGLLGLVGIALVAAAPFALADAWLEDRSPVGRVAERYLAQAPAPAAPSWTEAGAGLRGPEAGASEPLKRLAPLGPLVLGLLLFVPLAPEAPEALRHGLLILLLGTVVWLLPAPWGTGALVLPAAALCAGATARALFAVGGGAARLTGLFVALAAPVTLLGAFNAGTDLFTGAAVMTGGASAGEARARFVPDHALVTSASDRALTRQDLLLLFGPLTDCQYRLPVLRWPEAAELEDAEELAGALRAENVTMVAVDHGAAGVPPRESFARLRRIDRLPPESRLALYRVPRAGQGPAMDEAPADDAMDEPEDQAPGGPEAEAPQAAPSPE